MKRCLGIEPFLTSTSKDLWSTRLFIFSSIRRIWGGYLRTPFLVICSCYYMWVCKAGGDERGELGERRRVEKGNEGRAGLEYK